MKNHEVSPKALTAWIATAMLGPVALICARSSWVAVLVAAILCSVLCYAVFTFCEGSVWESRAYCATAIPWSLYAAAVIASECSVCWPGRGAQIAVPLVLIALAAASAYTGAHRASAVAATLAPLCVIIFAIVLACGIGNIQWQRVGLSTAAPGGGLLFVFLLPVTAIAIPRRTGAHMAGAFLCISVFAVMISLAVIGTLSLPVALTRKDAFFEFSKSLNLFSAVQRFESIVAVGVTLSVYSMLSLLLSGVNAMAEKLYPQSGKWAVLVGAALCAGIVVLKLWLDARIAALVSLFLWGILGVISQKIALQKRLKKHENNP